jgi:hypothetical protein
MIDHHRLLDPEISQILGHLSLIESRPRNPINDKHSCNVNAFFSFDLFMVNIPECKHYEIIHADTRYCTL